MLSATQPAGEADHFTYDPWNPVPTGAAGGYSRTPADQREVQKRRDVLVYSTPPLQQEVEVTGPLTVTLWIASSATDTDFTARLTDVFPDGTARALNDGILRARYRKSRTKPELLTPGEPTEITIDLAQATPIRPASASPDFAPAWPTRPACARDSPMWDREFDF